MSKSLKMRIQNKHDVEANWLLAENFIPLAGEVIIYDPDETHDKARIKIGDGNTLINALDFIVDPSDTSKVSQKDFEAHTSNATHITADERTAWNATKNTVASISATYETKEEAAAKLAEAKAYTNTKFSEVDAYTKAEMDDTLAALEAAIGGKAAAEHLHDISDVTGLQDSLNAKVPVSRTVNGKPLSSDISLSAADVDAAPATHEHGDVYYNKTELDGKFSAVNTSVNNIVNGTTKVGKAGTADNAAKASTADSATKATQDGNGKDISATYETKSDASSKLAEAKTYTDTKTSGLASTSTVDSKIGTHNTATEAHNDIRLLISTLTERLNTLANSDDTDLDTMKEIVAYIKSNKSLIDGITTTKINVADIIDNLTTNVAGKPLSAAQGVVLKGLIDALDKEVDEHTHNYAGSATPGGAATSANKLNTNDGSATNPVYFKDGVPVKTAYTLEKSVPADAKFTDTVYTHPTHTAKTSGLYKITVDGEGHVSNTAAVEKADITALGIPAQDTTYSTGTATASGLTKLYTGTGNKTDGTITQSAITSALAGKETAGAAAEALTEANTYTDNKVSDLISYGTADPNASITSQFYFKYATE